MPTRAGPPNLYSDEAAMKLKEAEESESSHEHSLMVCCDYYSLFVFLFFDVMFCAHFMFDFVIHVRWCIFMFHIVRNHV